MQCAVAPRVRWRRQRCRCLGADGIAVVVEALQRHINSAAVAQAACGTLGRVAHVDFLERPAGFATAGCLPAIYAALQNHLADADVVITACGLAQRIWLGFRKSYALAVGVGALMIDAAKLHAGQAAVEDAVCAALRHLCRTGPTYFDQLASAVSCHRVAQALRRTVVVKHALAAVRHALRGEPACIGRDRARVGPTADVVTMAEFLDPFEKLMAAFASRSWPALRRAAAACTRRLHLAKREQLVWCAINCNPHLYFDDQDQLSVEDYRLRCSTLVLELLDRRGLLDTAAVNSGLHDLLDGTSASSVALVRRLLEFGADARSRNRKWTGRHCLDYNMDIDTLRVLLEAGADPNARGIFGGLPLNNCGRYCRFREGDVPAVMELLLDHGADPLAMCGTNTPLDALLFHADYLSGRAVRLLARAAAWHRRRHLLMLLRARSRDDSDAWSVQSGRSSSSSSTAAATPTAAC